MGVTLARALLLLWWRLSRYDPGEVLRGKVGGSLLSMSKLAIVIITIYFQHKSSHSTWSTAPQEGD